MEVFGKPNKHDLSTHPVRTVHMYGIYASVSSKEIIRNENFKVK